MLRAILFLCLWVLSQVDSQPVSCTDRDQCSEGYYCDVSAHSCRECLHCQDLNREPPLKLETCIESVSDCGACFKGLVPDRLGDVNAACVMSGAEESGGTPHYVWWLGSTIIIFLALMIAIIVYIYLNPGIFENFKFGGNCQSGTVSTNIRTETRASAPELPPPYTPAPLYNHVPYSSVRTADSPCPPHEPADNNVYTDEEGPFIKPSSPPQLPGHKETAGSQAARVYNPPIYEREELPHGPQSPIVTEVNDNLPIHDEETVESTWSPSGQNNGDINANVNESTGNAGSQSNTLSAMLAVARDDSLFEHTPPKQMRIQPSLTYTNRESNPGGDSNQGNFSGHPNGPPYNFITQITNVVQFNRST